MELTPIEKELMRLKQSYSALQSKAATQRNEIARLTQLVEGLRASNKKLTSDLKWMRGETYE